MTDICMCPGKNCPLKEKCYRYKALPGDLQNYFPEPPQKDGECEYFMTIPKLKSKWKS